jgi:hypothetical protein
MNSPAFKPDFSGPLPQGSREMLVPHLSRLQDLAYRNLVNHTYPRYQGVIEIMIEGTAYVAWPLHNPQNEHFVNQQTFLLHNTHFACLQDIGGRIEAFFVFPPLYVEFSFTQIRHLIVALNVLATTNFTM